MASKGQEMDDEIKGEGNSVNYKYRMHDPRVGRFFAIDPLAPEYPHNSPYAFSENIVINAVELEGLERDYKFNSAYKSDQARAVIERGSFTEIRDHMRSQIGLRFSSPEALKYAKDKLGRKFDSSNGWNPNDNSPSRDGNLALRTGYGSDKNYFTVRLIVKKDDGTWGEQHATITNPEFIKSELLEINKDLKEINKELSELLPHLDRVEAVDDYHNHGGIDPNPTPSQSKVTTRHLSGERNKIKAARETKFVKLGEAITAIRVQYTREALTERKTELLEMKSYLMKRKSEFENKKVVEFDK